jgi:3-hydroxybutyryl-CoA dehydrogenase
MARTPDTPLPSPPSIQSVLIIGAGWTGRQIAGQMVAFGVEVTVADNNASSLDLTEAWIAQQRIPFSEQGFWPPIDDVSLKSRLHRIDRLESLTPSEAARFDLVLESVSEQFSLKRRIFQKCSKIFPESTLLASNSSYFVPSMMNEHITAPERFAHFHFHVPVWRATLVDIVPGPSTSESTVQRLVELANRIGQTPLVQRVENPGYVFNWMLKSLLQSALQLVARGVAQPKDIDIAWKKVSGMPLGPFGMMDQIGIDLIHQTMSHARFVDGDGVWQPLIDILQPYIEKNELGMKSGKGFFDYQAGVQSADSDLADLR